MSGPAAQLDSYMSLASTPEMDVNSMQLGQVPLHNAGPEQKTISPFDDTLLPHQQSPVSSSMEPPVGHTVGTTEDTPSLPLKQNPDDTIPHIVTKPSSPVKSPHIQAVKVEPPPHDLPYATKIQHLTTPPMPLEPLKQEAAIATIPSQASRAELEATRPDSDLANKVSAYARLEFENFIFYVQTLQVILGRKSENDQSHSVDVHLGSSKAISRKHAKIFYNFGTERFELSIQGKNGAFVDDVFVERGATVPLTNKSKIQIGQIVFRFVLPGGGNPSEKGESPSKPLNPSDAVSLKSTLYTNRSNDGLDESGENTPNLTSMDFEPVSGNTTALGNQPNGGTDTPTAGAPKKPVKEKKPPRVPKPPKKVYTLEEIPEEYRTKPNCSYSNLIATCLRTHGTPKGMSLAEIYKSIRDIFPYYKYCPDGWQSSVRHNLSLNKAFRKVSKEGKGWLWGLDEEYCAEKEKAKKKQQAVAAAKAKAAAIKIEQQQQSQKQQQQKQLQMAQAAHQFQQQANVTPNPGMIQQGQVQMNPQTGFQGTQIQAQPLVTSQQQQVQSQLPQQPVAPQMPVQAQTPQQSPVQQSPLQVNTVPQQVQQRPPQIAPQQGLSKTPSIQAQLAANRGVTPTPPTRVTPPAQSTPARTMGADTKKALAHLQQQLVLLSKDLRTLVDKPSISAILTQAIAMTIAQVTQAAKSKGITSDPLTTLIDTNPQQLTKILTVALNAATYKVTNGRIKAPLSLNSSATASRAATPVPTPQLPKAQPLAQQHQPVPQQQQQQQQQPQPVVQQPVPQAQPGVQQPVPQQPAQHQALQQVTQPVVKHLVPQEILPQQLQQTQAPQAQQTLQQASAQLSQTLQQQPTQPVQQASQAPEAQSTPVEQIEPTPVQTSASQPPALQASQPVQHHVQHSNTQNAPTSTEKPVGTAVPPIPTPSTTSLQKAPELQKSTSPVAPASKSQDTMTGVNAQSTPYTQPFTTSSPVVNSVAPHIAKTQAPATSEPVSNSQISTSSVGSSSAQTPVVQSYQQTPQPQTNSSSEHPEANGIQKTPTPTPVATQTPVEAQLPIVTEAPVPASTTESKTVEIPEVAKDTKHTEPDLSFLNDDLNDPEFDKVLQSLSKEGTPGLENDNQKVMDDEELNRLLAQDFEEATKDNSNGGTKRNFDDLDSSMLMDEGANKMAKTE